MKEPKLIQLLNLVTDEKNFTNPQRGRVYSPDGIAPALNTCRGAVSNRRLLFGCAMRGRNPDNPKDRKTKSNGTFRQMIEIGKFGISNTITSVQKDSMVAEVRQKKQVFGLSRTRDRAGWIEHFNLRDVTNTIHAQVGAVRLNMEVLIAEFYESDTTAGEK